MSRTKPKQTPKRVLRLPDLDFAKSAVLNTLRSPESKRSYRFAIDDFVAWCCSEPRIAFNKTVVLRYACGRRTGADPIPSRACQRADDRKVPRVQTEAARGGE
jgi:hypothetical protein